MLTRIGILTILIIAAADTLGAEPQVQPVGAARVDVTPDYPVLLNGYAARPAQEFKEVHQRLYARAIAIGGDKPVVIISVDSQGISATVRVGSSRVDLQACKLEYSIVSPK